MFWWGRVGVYMYAQWITAAASHPGEIVLLEMAKIIMNWGYG